MDVLFSRNMEICCVSILSLENCGAENGRSCKVICTFAFSHCQNNFLQNNWLDLSSKVPFDNYLSVDGYFQRKLDRPKLQKKLLSMIIIYIRIAFFFKTFFHQGLSRRFSKFKRLLQKYAECVLVLES